MTTNRRAMLLAFGMLGMGLVFGVAFCSLPACGAVVSPYGELINRIAPVERLVTDMVSAVNFDYRGFDTLGEEFILFASVLGVVVLLRDEPRASDVREERTAPVSAARPNAAVRATALFLVGPTALFGFYVMSHGQLTPGGGFQGGVISATAPLLAYLATTSSMLTGIAPMPLVQVAEALAMATFVGLGWAGPASGQAFLENVWALGTSGSVLSGGGIFVLNLVTGWAVAGGFLVLLTKFVEQSRRREGSR